MPSDRLFVEEAGASPARVPVVGRHIHRVHVPYGRVSSLGRVRLHARLEVYTFDDSGLTLVKY